MSDVSVAANLASQLVAALKAEGERKNPGNGSEFVVEALQGIIGKWADIHPSILNKIKKELASLGPTLPPSHNIGPKRIRIMGVIASHGALCAYDIAKILYPSANRPRALQRVQEATETQCNLLWRKGLVEKDRVSGKFTLSEIGNDVLRKTHPLRNN